MKSSSSECRFERVDSHRSMPGKLGVVRDLWSPDGVVRRYRVAEYYRE